MKKILLLSILTVGICSCNLDINTDPDQPTDVSAALIFPAIPNSIAAAVGDGLYNYAGFFAQYYEQRPESNQYNDISEYNFTESSQLIDRSYRAIYAGALQDIEEVKARTENTSDLYAATVLRAYCFQLMVDNMDQVPYTEALQGSAIPAPKWDSGQSVYEGILAEMDAAESVLDNSTMSCTDLMFSKNMSQWIGFANALRLRMYLRFIDGEVNVSEYTAKLTALINESNFFSDDVKYDVFSDEVDKRNPWYSANYINLTQNHCGSYPIVSYLKTTNDPRIAYNFVPATNTGTYEGAIPGTKTELSDKRNADYSFLNYYATKPVYFFTQSELQFLLAESYLRFFNDDASAKAAYEAGIDADFEARGMSESPDVMYGASGRIAWSTASDTGTKLKLIYMQKWVALCYMDHMEAWSEIRRTGCPELSSYSARQIYEDPTLYTSGDLIAPWRNSFGDRAMVKRMYFPATARQLNVNTPTSVSPTVPVWWCKK